MSTAKCVKCNIDIKRNTKRVSCVLCEEKFHSACTGVSEDILELISEDKNLKYCCDACNSSKSISDLKQMLKICLNKMNEQSDIIDKQIKMMDSKLSDTDTFNRKKENIGGKKKYSDVLLIKPITEQNCVDTRSDLLDNIDPGKLKIGVDEIKNTKNGGLRIECDNSKSKEIISAEVKEKFGEKYEVVEAKQRNPMMVIKGVEGKYIDYEDDEIITRLINQNELNSIDSNIINKIKIEKKFLTKRRKNCCNIVMSLQGNIYEKIKEKMKINIGWRKCYMNDYYNIVRCFKCAGFSHFAKDCKSTVTCFNCAADHDTKVCKSAEKRCTNCINKNKKLGINLDVGHTALDSRCPCYKRIVDVICKKTAYGGS